MTGLCLATGALPIRNTLHAQDLAGQSIETYAQMDSLFRTVYDPVVSPGKGKGWKPFGRMEWFYGQRAFPDGVIPHDARMRAWEEKQNARNRHTLDENWTAIGPDNIAGRILSIAWHPTNVNIIYVGSASGGLWKTTNGGTSWTPLTDDLPSLAVGSVVLDPNNPNVVYIGTGEGAYNVDAVYGAGILKSTDGGATWNTTGMSWTQSQGRAVNKLLVHPTDSQILWCATNIWSGGGGVYKTTNGGSSWTRYLAGDAKDIILHPDSSSVLYAAIGYPWGGASNGVYKSTDGGLTWTLRSDGLPAATSMGRMALSISPSSPQTVYVGISQTISAGAGLLGIYRTTDAGASWTLQANSPNMYSGQGWYNIVCEVHPTNPAIVYSAGLDLYKSTNSGVNWTQKTYWNYTPGHSLYAHADHHALAFKPGDPNTIICGTDGGLYKSTNGGDTWVGINSGLVTFQYYAMCNDYLNANVAYGGSQDNGTVKYNNSASQSWILGGDGGYCVVDYTNSNIVYASTQRGAHYKSTNGGASFVSIQSGISGSGAWVTPTVMDPANPNVLYTGTTMVYKTTNGGTSWSAISTSLSSSYISTIAVAPSNPQVIYIGYENNGQVWKTTNGGTNWSSCYSGLPYRYITRVAVHPSDPNTVFVTVSGYSTGHVWKSTDGGGTWSNASTGIPDVPCNAIVVDPNDPTKLYVATDIGVYASTNGGTSWSDYSNGLPNVVVDDIALHPTTGMLRASTHGRGLWQTPTSAPSVAVISPNGGESWITGSTQSITWGTGGLSGNVRIELNRSYPSGSWEDIAASTPNDGSHPWTVTGPVTSAARVRVTSIESPSATDVSNGDFAITQPVLTLTAPVGGESWPVASSQTISWTISGASGNVVVQLDRSFPSGNWETLATTSATSYAWTVTTPATGSARVRAYLQSNPAVSDTCNANFAIVEPSVTVVYPNGGETFTPGTLTTIRWSRQYLSGTVKVELNRSYPSGTWVSLATSVSVDTLLWTVDQNGTTAARIRVTSNSYPSATDVSNANFTVLTPSLAVTSPNGGEVLNAGAPATIRWSRTNLGGALNVYVNRDYPGGSWTAIGVSVTADTFVWNVLAPYSNNARIRVASVGLPAFYDESNADFVIGTGMVVNTPNGAENWPVGSAQTISWTRYNAAGAATVQINRSYPGGSWETLSSSVTTSSLAWTVTGPGTTTARVRVYLNASPAIGDTSDGGFSIPAPTLTLTSPNGGEQWAVGSSQTIAWTRSDAAGNVTVQLNRAYPGGSWETLTTTAAGSSIAWTVTSPAASSARVRIFLTSSPSVGDTSTQDFAIGVPQLALSSPDGGELWLVGSGYTIRWTRQFAAGDVRVLLNRSYPGGSWETLASAVAVDTFRWTVTSPAATAARVRIYLLSSSAVADTSAANFTIAVPGITVNSPNGGEQWVIGVPQTITFTRANAAGEATIQLNRNFPAGSWETIANAVTGSSAGWTPSGAASSACRVRVYLTSSPSVRDSSDANFSLIAASLTVTSPNGGEQWIVGNNATITWSRTGADGAVTVALNRAYPSGTWEVLTSTETGNSFVWPVSGAATTTARVRVTLNGNPSLTDESNANFTIIQPALTLSVPDGGETYTLGGPLTVRWSRTAAAGGVSVQLNRNYPGGAWETLATGVTADTMRWTSSGTASSACRVRIRLDADTTIGDLSAGNFSLVQRVLTLTSHNGGEMVYTGSSSTVTFERTNATGNVTVQLNRNYPAGSWETLSSTVSSSSYNWGVSGAVSGNARLRIFLTSESFVADTSNASFTIAAPSLTLIAPNGGEQWPVGSAQTIRWQHAGVSENVRLELKRNYPSGSWETIASSVSGSAYLWTVSGTAGSSARVRVVSTVTSSIADTSDASFSILTSPLVLNTPNGGETVSIGFPAVIRWTRVSLPGEVRIELNRAWPSGSWELLGATTADSLVWSVSGPATSAARVKLYLTATPTIGDTSAGNFAIVQPAITLTSPVGGERWATGNFYAVTWMCTGLTGAVRVDLNTNYPSDTWTTLASGQTGTSYAWTVNAPVTEHARVRVVHETYPQFADSSGDFAIVVPGVSVVSPNGGDTLVIGQARTIRWLRSGVSGAVKVELNRSYPAGSWETLHAGTSADTLLWTVAGSEAAQARIRVSLVSDPAVLDVSDTDFLIARQSVVLVSPVAGDSIALGMAVPISWVMIGVSGGANVYLKRNWPAGSWELLASNVTTGSYQWTASGSASETARFRVLSALQPTLGDTTDGAVRIGSPQLLFAAPASADTFYAAQPVRIAWTRRFAPGAVRVELSRSGSDGPWQEIGIADGDSLMWNATGPATSSARFRITLAGASFVTTTTAFNCAIHEPSLALNAPAGGATCAIGRNLIVSWNRTTCPWPVDVLLERSAGGPVEVLRSGVSADSIHWRVTPPATESARLTIRTASGVMVSAQSAQFALATPQITLVAPHGGEMWIANRIVTVSWRQAVVADPVRIELNRDYPGGVWSTLASPVSDTLFVWNITGPTTTRARLRVVSTVDSTLADICTSDLQIWVPQIALGELGRSRVIIGFPVTISWMRTAVNGPVDLLLSRDGGVTWPVTIAEGVTEDEWEWIPGEPATTQARVMVRSVEDPQVSDTTDAFELALPQLALSAPAGGETFALGMPLSIRWTRTDHPGAVSVQMNRNYPVGGWQTLAAHLDADSFLWHVTGPESDSVRIRVVSDVNGSWFAESGTFALRAAAVRMTLPLPGQELFVSDSLHVAWQRIAHTAPVRVLLCAGSGGSYTLGTGIAGNTLSTVVPPIEADSAWIIVEDAAALSPRDSVLIYGPFVLRLSITTPVDGSRWIAARRYWLHVERHHAEGELLVRWNGNFPFGSWETLASLNSDSVELTAPSTETSALAIAVSHASRPAATDTVFAIRVIAPRLRFVEPQQTALRVSDVLNVSWTVHEIDSIVRLELDRHYPSGEWEPLYEGFDTGYVWTITGDTSSHARLRLICPAYPEAGDTLDRDLVLYRPALYFADDLAPSYTVGEVVHVEWISEWLPGPFTLLLLRGDALPETLASGLSQSGYDWPVSPPRGENVRFIVQESDFGLADTSESFSVREPRLRFVQPAESGTDTVGSTLELVWEWTDGAGPVRLELVRDSLSAPWTLVADAAESPFLFEVTAPETDSLWFRISSPADPAVFAISPVRRVVQPALALHVEGGTWYVGEQRVISWTRAHYDGPVTVELTNGDRAAPWVEMAADVLVDSLLWTVTGPVSDLVALRVTAIGRPGVFDTTDTPLRIAMPRVEVLAPNGGETLEIGEAVRLRWIGEGFAGPVAIALWRGDPVYRFDTLFVETPNDSEEIWTVDQPPAHDCRLVVVSLLGPELFDSSDGYFEITDGSSAHDPFASLPREYSFAVPYPNPFNSSVNLEFALPRDGPVSLVVFDVLGREVERLVDESRRAGVHRVAWRADHAPSGVYFVRLSSGGYQAVRRLHLLK